VTQGRRAHRRRDPEALAAIVLDQLTAYSCSTIYAPSATRLDAFVRDMVLPRLHDKFDARTVIVDNWDKERGPTVQQLASELCRQLELGDGDHASPAALDTALRRAERRSDRPLVIVLYRLEQLLDDGRDPAEVNAFLDALNRIAARPTHGLHLVMGVREEDLGGFRELLRGRWRLLINDVRIRPDDARGLVPVPLLATFLASPGAVIATLVATLVGGVVAGALLDTPEPPPPCVCNEPAPSTPPVVTPLVTPPLVTPPVVAPPVPVAEPASTGDATTGELDMTTGEPPAPATTGPPPAKAPKDVPAPKDMCQPTAKDNGCAACVRMYCCDALQACKKSKWRNCVMKGPLGEGECTPESVEKGCRDLALCAFENQCRPACFNN
jgi:hypothetical protein